MWELVILLPAYIRYFTPLATAISSAAACFAFTTASSILLSPLTSISAGFWIHGTLQARTDRLSGLLQQPQNQGKAEGLAACSSQTASPFGRLNNFCFELLSNFLGSLHMVPGFLGILKSRSALAELRCATSGFEAGLREFLSCFSLIFRAFPAFYFSVIRCADHKKRPFFIQR